MRAIYTWPIGATLELMKFLYIIGLSSPALTPQSEVKMFVDRNYDYKKFEEMTN